MEKKPTTTVLMPVMIPPPDALRRLKRVDLQKLCKAYGIKANTKNQKMMADLERKRQQLCHSDEEESSSTQDTQSTLDQTEAVDEPRRDINDGVIRKGSRKRKQGTKNSRNSGSHRRQPNQFLALEESCSSRSISNRSTPVPEPIGPIPGNVQQIVLDSVSVGLSPAFESGANIVPESVVHQDAPSVQSPPGLSPVPQSSLSPNDCQKPVSIDLIPSGTSSGQAVAHITAFGEESSGPVVTEAAINESGHVCPEMTEQPVENNTDPSISIPDIKNSSIQVVELLENRSQETTNTTLERAREKDKELFESEDIADVESDPVVDDVIAGETGEVNQDDEAKLNTTYTICSPEQHLEDPQAVLSQSLNMTPRQTDSPLLGTWASSGSFSFLDKESDGKELLNAGCEIKDLIKARSQQRDSPLISTWATPSATRTSSHDKENQDSQSDNTHNEVMELLNSRVQQRVKDSAAFEQELEKTREEVTKSKPLAKSTKGAHRFAKAHAHQFNRMESITSTYERKRKATRPEQPLPKRVKTEKLLKPVAHKGAMAHSVKRNLSAFTKTPRSESSVGLKKSLSKSSSRPPFRF